MNRRKFLGASSAFAGTLASLPAKASSGINVPVRTGFDQPHCRASFTEGFIWGSATAAYQVEGAVAEAGRAPSIWDTFSHAHGKIHNGDTGDLADDEFHRYKEDIALMKTIGLKAYRFSVAWSRIFPNGSGSPNPRGLDFYKAMLDELHHAGIAPYCTLYHWDLPQALEDKGGWQNPDTAKAFADYCAYTSNQLSGQVTHFITMNEMKSFVDQGYGDGSHAPGLRLSEGGLAQTAYYVALGHGLAVKAIRAASRSGTKIGIADNVQPTTPILDTPEHVRAAQTALREENARYLTLLMEGTYTDAYLRRLGIAAPHFTSEELTTISTPLDFVGLNIYGGVYVRAADNPLGYAIVPPPSSYPHMLSDWLLICPEALYWVPKLAASVWGIKNIYVTENGCSSDDQIADDGHIYDSDRIMFLRNCIANLQRATAEGVPIKGYFLWSLLDNFEWVDGYSKRFGITYVDFATQRRTPKMSSMLYRDIIARNGLA